MADILTAFLGLGLVAGLTFYFFGPKKAATALMRNGFQEIENLQTRFIVHRSHSAGRSQERAPCHFLAVQSPFFELCQRLCDP